MTSRRTLLRTASALSALWLAAPTLAQSSEPLRVVATFSILGDMVDRIGGEHIALTTLVGPDGDSHVYQPTPQDAAAVSQADILIQNGLEFEGWLERLTEAASFDGALVVATTGIEAIAYDEHDDHQDDHGDEHAEGDQEEDHADDHDDHDDGEDHGEAHAGEEHEDDHDEEHAEGEHEDDHHHHHHGAFDPHAWQSLDNAVVYVNNITAALAQADPDNAATFYANRAEYVAEIEALDSEIHEIMAGLPEAGRSVVTSHDAFQYFGRDYGLTFLAPQGLSTESEASAQDVAHLIEQMREQGITAVFIENISDSRLLEQIASETGATIGGTLYPGALSGPDGPAPTYLDMLRHNAMTLAAALGS